MKSKLFVCWLAMVALAFVVAGSCSIKHQSEQYECDVTADCQDLGDGRAEGQGRRLPDHGL